MRNSTIYYAWYQLQCLAIFMVPGQSILTTPNSRSALISKAVVCCQSRIGQTMIEIRSS